MTMRTERAADRRRGFTLLELLLVIAIISVLIALLLPAIQSSRELARRLQCSKNLMQIGLAMGNYAASNRVFPPGVVNETGPISSVPAGYHWGWAARILPFLEQGNLYNQINFSDGVYEPVNDTTRGRHLYVFLCPSDGSPTLTSYAGVHHDVEAPIAADNHGMFFLNSRVTHDDIKDGPAFTILAGEFMQKSQTLGWAVGTRSTLRNTGSVINAAVPFVFKAPSWSGNMGGQADAELNELEDMIEDERIDPMYVGGFSSHHAGGANFVFADGSVRFLTERIRPSIFQSLGHRADGNLISADDY